MIGRFDPTIAPCAQLRRTAARRSAAQCLAILAVVYLPVVGARGETPPRNESPDDGESVSFFAFEPAPLTEPLVTDRPDFTESTVTVPRGHLQIESGYTFTFEREGDGRSANHTAPEILLRAGLADDFELRIGWEGWSATENLFREKNDVGRHVRREDTEDGATDMDVGFKFHLLDQSGWVPDFGVITAITVPTGASSTTSGDVDPQVGLLWAYDLTESLALAGNINFAAPTSDGRRFFQTSASISAAYALTERVGAYAEYFGFYPNDRGADCAHYVNGGLTYLITNNFQVDIRAGMGLNEEADDFFTGIGFAWRI